VLDLSEIFGTFNIWAQSLSDKTGISSSETKEKCWRLSIPSKSWWKSPRL